MHNVVQFRLYRCVYACTRIYVAYCIEMLSAMYRDVLAQRSLGKTTSRLSNYRSCIMHRSTQVDFLRSLSLSPLFYLSLQVSISFDLPLLCSNGVLVDCQKTRFWSSGDKATEMLASASAEILYQISFDENERG